MQGRTSDKKRPESYRERTYRTMERSGLVSTYVTMVETDLHILAPVRVEDAALQLVAECRRLLEGYIRANPLFASSLEPLPGDGNAPVPVREMLRAGAETGVGPMAAVAGTVAAFVGRGLLDRGIDDLIVENGGDIFMARRRECTVAVFAGTSPLSRRIGLRIMPEQMPCAVCCSSGTIGHSLSLGRADAAVVVATDAALADAAATRIGNETGSGRKGIDQALRVAAEINDLTGALVVRGDKLGAWGALEIVRL